MRGGGARARRHRGDGCDGEGVDGGARGERVHARSDPRGLMSLSRVMQHLRRLRPAAAPSPFVRLRPPHNAMGEDTPGGKGEVVLPVSVARAAVTAVTVGGTNTTEADALWRTLGDDEARHTARER